MRPAGDGPRVDEEEELAGGVIGVVQHQLLVLEQPVLAGGTQPELAGRDVALLLGPERLHVQSPDPGGGLEAEVARRDPLRQVARRRQLDAHVAHLHPLQQLARPALVVDVDVVRGVELPPLVVVDVHVDPVGDHAAHLHPELDVRPQPRERVRAAAELERRVARPVAVPGAAQLAAPLDLEPEVRHLLHHLRQLQLTEPGHALRRIFSRRDGRGRRDGRRLERDRRQPCHGGRLHVGGQGPAERVGGAGPFRDRQPEGRRERCESEPEPRRRVLEEVRRGEAEAGSFALGHLRGRAGGAHEEQDQEERLRQPHCRGLGSDRRRTTGRRRSAGSSRL